jgi:SAM-dependent methyltransferase
VFKGPRRLAAGRRTMYGMKPAPASPPATPAVDVSALPFSPAAERNARPILAALSGWLPPRARVLEVASGTGQHAAHFVQAQPGWTWQPTEAQAQALPALAARCAGLPQALPPLQLDVLAPAWPVAEAGFDAVYCANLLHIAPWSVTPAFFAGAARSLAQGGTVAVYGPFIVDGEPLAPSNAAFDADLRARNPAWGLRRMADVVLAAKRAGLVLQERLAMPANNLLLRFGRCAVENTDPETRP